MPQKACPCAKSRKSYACGLRPLDQDQIARSCSIGQATVHRYLKKAAAAGLSWPLPEDCDDRRLDELLFPVAPAARLPTRRASVDFAATPRRAQTSPAPDAAVALGRISGNSTGRLRLQPLLRTVPTVEAANQDVVLRQEHRAGEKMFVDWAGATIPIYDPQSGRSDAGLDLRRRARRQHLHLCASHRRARIWRTGSTATCAPSSSSAASPSWSFRITRAPASIAPAAMSRI